jgi:uncharacterized membrane protein YkvA (DUF1232 family)
VIKRFLIGPLANFLSRHPGLAIAVAVAYLLAPLDLLPELFAGVAGYLDDLILLVGVLWLTRGLKRKKKPGVKKDANIVDTTAEIEKGPREE